MSAFPSRIQLALPLLAALFACDMSSDLQIGRLTVTADARILGAPVNAVDFFLLDSASFKCADLLMSDLSGGLNRAVTMERARTCPRVGDSRSVSRTLGKATKGPRTLLVMGTSLPGPCTTDGNEELTTPGQVLTAGCEEITIEGGKAHDVFVVTFPHRDP